MELKQIGTDTFFLAESALWCPEKNSYFFVNIFAGELFQYVNANGQLKKHKFGEIVSAVLLNNDGRLIVATQKGIGFYDPDTEVFTPKVHPNAEWDKVSRYNDCKCDPCGRLYAGTMDLHGRKEQVKLFRIKSDWSWEIALDNVDYSNGIVWDRDKMFYTDTYSGEVYSFDYAMDTGEIKNRKVLCQFPKGWPDGMAMDKDGNLWIALWGGFGLACVDQVTGKVLRNIKLPVPNVSSICFGGKNVLITTAQKDLSKEEMNQYRQAGAVYFGEIGVQGREFCRGKFF